MSAADDKKSIPKFLHNFDNFKYHSFLNSNLSNILYIFSDFIPLDVL